VILLYSQQTQDLFRSAGRRVRPQEVRS